MATPHSTDGASTPPVDIFGDALQTLYQSTSSITPQTLATTLFVIQSFNDRIANSVYDALGGGACGAVTVRGSGCTRLLRQHDKLKCLESLAMFAGAVERHEPENVLAKTVEDRIADFKKGYDCGYHVHGDLVAGTKRGREADEGERTPQSSAFHQRKKSKSNIPVTGMRYSNGSQLEMSSKDAPRTPPPSVSHRRKKSKSKRQSPSRPSSDRLKPTFPSNNAEPSTQQSRVETTLSSMPALFPAHVHQPIPQQPPPPSQFQQSFDSFGSDFTNAGFSLPTAVNAVSDADDANSWLAQSMWNAQTDTQLLDSPCPGFGDLGADFVAGLDMVREDFDGGLIDPALLSLTHETQSWVGMQ